ncbi:hypothetical protein C4577_03075 [Candidatus Parcubacteria bacterium]|nr:MAG: hypothetical protein C4577_03075 [Candidatus Parcubacteria bacterium]
MKARLKLHTQLTINRIRECIGGIPLTHDEMETIEGHLNQVFAILGDAWKRLGESDPKIADMGMYPYAAQHYTPLNR